MFSKEEASKIRKEFWTNFGKSFPRKWLLYNTKIKDLSLKFYAGQKTAFIAIDIEMKDKIVRKKYFDKFISLKNIFHSELPNLIFEKEYVLDNGKSISRIYLPIDKKVSIYNKNSWFYIYEFFNNNMYILENLFIEYKDYIQQI